MARKRPIEEAPPAASSSEEEEETESEEEEETRNGTVQTEQNDAGENQDDGDGGREDDGDDEEDDDDEEGKEKPILPPSKPSKPSSETDSEDTELTEPQSPSLSGFTIKPISPKKRKPGPELEQPKIEKGGDAKKGKRRAVAEAEGSHRLWSDEDEIVILNGISQYQNEKGKNPFADTGDFHGFLKESLHVNVTNKQFADKIRKLKKKYFTEVGKNENEIDDIFSKQHDLECVELAKKIWGAGGTEVEKEGNSRKKSGKIVSSGGGSDGGGRVGGGITLALPRKGSEEANGEKGKVSVKKRKRGSSEEVNREGKEGDLKKQRQGYNEQAGRGEEGQVKMGKRGLGEETKREGKGKGKGKGGMMEKRTADEELSEKGEEGNVTVNKQKVNDEMNGVGMGSSAKKRSAVSNEEVDGKEEGSEDFWDKYPYLRSSLDGENLPDDMKKSTMLMLRMVRKQKLVELEREWKSLMKVKLEFVAKQKHLIGKQIKLSLDAMESHDS